MVFQFQVNSNILFHF